MKVGFCSGGQVKMPAAGSVLTSWGSRVEHHLEEGCVVWYVLTSPRR